MNEPEDKDNINTKEKELLSKRAEIHKIRESLSRKHITTGDDETNTEIISFLLKRL